MNFILDVLAYSPSGVYVEIENEYAITILDLNTETHEVFEVSHEVRIDDACRYELSFSEIATCIQYFQALLN